MENFIYHTPTKVYFGKGEENKIGKIIKEYHPNKVLILYGGGSIKKIGLLDKVISLLKEENLSYISIGGVKPNPKLPFVYEALKTSKEEGVDFVLAIGGGSVLDTAKDIANGLANPNDDVWDYHLHKKEPKRTLHKGAVLTIAAAGSEMSASSVITNPDTEEKIGYLSEFNRFDFAIENPELTYSVNKYQTACGIVDIGMHTIERFFDIGEDTTLTDSLALAVIKTVFKCGTIAYNEPTNYEARANIVWASSIAHNGLTHMGRKFSLVVHKLEHELSAKHPDIAHGAGLAALWCSWARYIYKSCLDRFYTYVKEIWNETEENEQAILNGIEKQEDYYKSIGMPTSLEELGIKEDELETLSLRCSGNKTKTIQGYKPLAYEDILNIYKLAYPKR